MASWGGRCVRRKRIQALGSGSRCSNPRSSILLTVCSALLLSALLLHRMGRFIRMIMRIQLRHVKYLSYHLLSNKWQLLLPIDISVVVVIFHQNLGAGTLVLLRQWLGNKSRVTNRTGGGCHVEKN